MAAGRKERRAADSPHGLPGDNYADHRQASVNTRLSLVARMPLYLDDKGVRDYRPFSTC